MCMVINQFLSLSNLCDMPRFHCATCSVFTVRLAPDYADSYPLLKMQCLGCFHSPTRESVPILQQIQIIEPHIDRIGIPQFAGAQALAQLVQR